MADAKESKESHLERTANEPRDLSLHTVVISRVTPVGQTVRLLRLQIPPKAPDIHFLPGQWIDTYCPGIVKPGGFTITSPPSRAVAKTRKQDATTATGTDADTDDDRYIELAVRRSFDSPATAWLWRQPHDLSGSVLLGATLQVRVGGQFVYPPRKTAASARQTCSRVVFVAGGVGVNPLMSMLSAIADEPAAWPKPEVVFLYSVREEAKEKRPSSSGDDDVVDDDDDDDGDGPPSARILFLERLAKTFSYEQVRGSLQLYLTSASMPTDNNSSAGNNVISCNEVDIPYQRRRITTADLDAAVNGHNGHGANNDVYVYVCGVPSMTDVFVAHLTASTADGGLALPSSRVLFEKWW